MADNAIVDLSNTPKRSVINPTPMGPPIPPEIQAAMTAASTAEDQKNSLPPEVSGVIGAIPTEKPVTPPLTPEEQMGNVAQSLASSGPQATPQLAPQPAPKKTLGQRMLPFIQLAGAIGGGMEAAGDPAHPPHGAEMMQHALEHGEQLKLEQQKMQGVDIPLAQAHSEYFKQSAPAKVEAAGIGAGAKVASAQIANKFKAIPGVGMFNTETRQVEPGTAQGITVTPEIAQQYGLPPDFIGKPMKLTDLAGMENAQSLNLTTVQGAKGPALVNKAQGTGKDLGLGSPAVSARQAGVNDTVDESGRIIPMTDAQRLARGAPKVGTALSVGKGENQIFSPAIEADTRLKQMYEQATDVTGASDQALLFNHIAMTGGQVKGLRMGQYLTEEHRRARGISEELGVMWNHLAAGQSLSPQQRINFVRLAEQVRQTKWDQAQREAQVLGINVPIPQDPDLPPIHPVTATPRPPQPAAQHTPGPGVQKPQKPKGSIDLSQFER